MSTTINTSATTERSSRCLRSATAQLLPSCCFLPLPRSIHVSSSLSSTTSPDVILCSCSISPSACCLSSATVSPNSASSGNIPTSSISRAMLRSLPTILMFQMGLDFECLLCNRISKSCVWRMCYVLASMDLVLVTAFPINLLYVLSVCFLFF